jgi:hypothetical protein
MRLRWILLHVRVFFPLPRRNHCEFYVNLRLAHGLLESQLLQCASCSSYFAAAVQWLIAASELMWNKFYESGFPLASNGNKKSAYCTTANVLLN